MESGGLDFGISSLAVLKSWCVPLQFWNLLQRSIVMGTICPALLRNRHTEAEMHQKFKSSAG